MLCLIIRLMLSLTGSDISFWSINYSILYRPTVSRMQYEHKIFNVQTDKLVWVSNPFQTRGSFWESACRHWTALLPLFVVTQIKACPANYNRLSGSQTKEEGLQRLFVQFVCRGNSSVFMQDLPELISLGITRCDRWIVRLMETWIFTSTKTMTCRTALISLINVNEATHQHGNTLDLVISTGVNADSVSIRFANFRLCALCCWTNLSKD